MTRKRRRGIDLRSFFYGAVAVTSYALAVRPRLQEWGATPEEAARPLPGDERVPSPLLNVTHAVNIAAAPGQVWPWLAQMGQGRGGLYSYDWLENRMGLDIHSAGRILPEFQDLNVGDRIPLNPQGMGPEVLALEPNGYLLLGGDSRIDPSRETAPVVGSGYVNLTWLFCLEERGRGGTRLIERARVDWSPHLPGKLDLYLFWEPGAFLMERKMLLGIKARAEALAQKG